jgi:hypothetical protein
MPCKTLNTRALTLPCAGNGSQSLDRWARSSKLAVASLRRGNSIGRSHNKQSTQTIHGSLRLSRSSAGAPGRLRTQTSTPPLHRSCHTPASPCSSATKLQSRAREPLNLRNLLQSANTHGQSTVRSAAPFAMRPETAPTASALKEQQGDGCCALEKVCSSDSCSQHNTDHPLGSDELGWEEEADSEPPASVVGYASLALKH